MPQKAATRVQVFDTSLLDTSTFISINKLLPINHNIFKLTTKFFKNKANNRSTTNKQKLLELK